MIGYPKGVKGYRLWCTEADNRKVIISRDVVFMENQMPFLSQESSSSANDENGNTQFEVELGSEHEKADVEIQEVAQESTLAVTEADVDQHDELANYQLARDRKRRTNIKPPSKFNDCEMLFYALSIAEQLEHSEPSTYAEAVNGPESKQWILAMKEEIESLIRNKTWILVDKVEFRRVISCKWVFMKKIESTEPGGVRFKARLVARGFNQEEGIDFNEVFSPVVKHTSIRVLLAVVARRNWDLQQLDVKTAFLNVSDDLHEAWHSSCHQYNEQIYG